MSRKHSQKRNTNSSMAKNPSNENQPVQDVATVNQEVLSTDTTALIDKPQDSHVERVVKHREEDKFEKKKYMKTLAVVLYSAGVLFGIAGLLHVQLSHLLTDIQSGLLNGHGSEVVLNSAGSFSLAAGMFALAGVTTFINYQDVEKKSVVARFHSSNGIFGIFLTVVGFILALSASSEPFGMTNNVSLALGMGGLIIGIFLILINVMELNHKVIKKSLNN